MIDRQLDFEGCSNVRDLGGLPAGDGRKTRWGALVRSDDPAKLTARGWDALWTHGVRTIITLFTEGMTEFDWDKVARPSGVAVVPLAIEDLGDQEFVHKWAASELWSTPLYYQDALVRWPERHAGVVAAFARAQPGGVLFHCKRGHDRTGIMALLFLALAGVPAADIVEDYELSLDPERDGLLNGRGTSSRAVILDTLASFEIDGYLRAGGLSRAVIDAARARLLAPG